MEHSTKVVLITLLCCALVMNTLGLFPFGSPKRITHSMAEVSGVTPSLAVNNQLWIHNDSLDQPRLFLIDHNGELSLEHQLSGSHSQPITNIDWEDLTSADMDPYDGANMIYVADSGNNFQWRQDLVIYALKEQSHPSHALSLHRRYFYRFPHQTRRPPYSYKDRNRCLDSEALFWREGELFLIGKCLFSGQAPLWRLPREEWVSSSPLTLRRVGHVDIPQPSHPLHERVTAAEYHPAGKLLAVLTYSSLWLYSITGPNQSPTLGQGKRCDLKSLGQDTLHQAEAVTWLTDDQRGLHSVSTSDQDHRPAVLTHSTHAQLVILTERSQLATVTINLIEKTCTHESTVYLSVRDR